MRLRQFALSGVLCCCCQRSRDRFTRMPQQDSKAGAVTFNKDVLPILQKNCQDCHRPGEIAPMSFLTYEDARPWAKAIKAAVVKRQMPPWFADPAYGHFANDRRLTRRRHRDARRVGGQRRAGGRSEGQAGAGRLSRRLEHQAGHDHRDAARTSTSPPPARSTTRTSS